MIADKGFLAIVDILWITEAIPWEDKGFFLKFKNSEPIVASALYHLLRS